jgi:hypothetical protein
MTRQVINSGLSITEGVWDKGNLTDLNTAFDRADTNFAELFDAMASGLGTSEDVAGTTYTLVLADKGKRKRFTSSSAVAVTVPAGLGADFTVTLEQAGTGQVTVTGSGATVNNYFGHTKLAGQYAIAALLGSATVNVFNLSGVTGI